MAIAGGYPDLSSLQNAGAATVSVRGAITYAAGTTGAIGSTTLFTVTGDVLVTWLAAKCTTDLTSGGLPTWNLGVTGHTNLWTPAGAFPDATGWDAGEWADFAGGAAYATGGTFLDNGNSALGAPISADILQTIAVATITGGVVRWYLQYIPLSTGATVTRHANLAAF